MVVENLNFVIYIHNCKIFFLESGFIRRFICCLALSSLWIAFMGTKSFFMMDDVVMNQESQTILSNMLFHAKVESRFLILWVVMD